MTKETPVTPPAPASELEILRAQVAELTAIKFGSLRTWCGHAEHPTMTTLAELIAGKLNWRGEALQSRTRIEQLEATLQRVREIHDRTCNLRQAVRDHPDEPGLLSATCEVCTLLDLDQPARSTK